uniref:Putative grp-2 430 glycine rich family n=1 Tax=Ixodes ricinus TaxID=34613 RepID=V5HBB6_IXORI
MGLTGITLVLVSLALLRKRRSPTIDQNGTRPDSQKDREGCDFYCWNKATNSYDQFFFTDGVRCFYNNGDEGSCKNGECHLKTNTGGPSHNDDDFPPTTKKPKQKKKKPKRRTLKESTNGTEYERKRNKES